MSRQFQNAEIMPKPTSRLQVTVDMELERFDERNQRLLQYAFAAFLEISPQAVQIVGIEQGSVKVIIELPTQSANRLLSAYQRHNPELVLFFAPLIVLDLRRETVGRERIQRKLSANAERAVATGFVGRFSMGGLIASKGYRFQEHYIVSRVIGWLRDPDFRALVPEGAGDVDVRFERPDGAELWFVQVKNHKVNLVEAREVFQKQFLDSEAESPDTWQRFYLAAPALHPRIQGLRTQVERLRDLRGMYGPEDPKWQDTLRAIQKTADALNLPCRAEFLVEKVYFDTAGLADLKGERTLRDRFVVDLQEWSGHKVSLEDAQTACLRLLDVIRQGMGKTLSRAVLEEALKHPSGEIGVVGTDDEAHTALKRELTIHRRNLYRLREQAAKYGSLNVPLFILSQIDDEEDAIQKVEQELARLKANQGPQ